MASDDDDAERLVSGAYSQAIDEHWRIFHLSEADFTLFSVLQVFYSLTVEVTACVKKTFL